MIHDQLHQGFKIYSAAFAYMMCVNFVFSYPFTWLTDKQDNCKWLPSNAHIYINKNRPAADDWKLFSDKINIIFDVAVYCDNLTEELVETLVLKYLESNEELYIAAEDVSSALSHCPLSSISPCISVDYTVMDLDKTQKKKIWLDYRYEKKVTGADNSTKIMNVLAQQNLLLLEVIQRVSEVSTKSMQTGYCNLSCKTLGVKCEIWSITLTIRSSTNYLK
ncbi:hypothetical protein FQA39_LY16208 [Lamprigera yunnana]|nr:hypothetical protein FQA39_LY16208 [Lamprigera yunnana]